MVNDEDISKKLSLKILFVCIGNSCRSPMAETILKSLLTKLDTKKIGEWEIDSAALRSWNVGYPPEDRCILVLGENGLSSSHVCRKVTINDFHKFDYIFGMDSMHMEELLQLCPENANCKIELLGKYSSKPNEIILDPYFETGTHGFYRCFDQISECFKNFLQTVIEHGS